MRQQPRLPLSRLIKGALLTSLLSVSALNVASAEPAKSETYNADVAHSAVIFKVKHLNVAYTYGRFTGFEATYNHKEGAESVSFSIDASSVNTENKKRDDHLRGPDFFNVNEFPKITFKSTAWKKTGDNSAEVTGELSLHGVTKTITVPVVKTGEGDDPWGNHRVGFEATFKVKRSEFGITYGPQVASDEIEMTLSFEGVRKKGE